MAAPLDLTTRSFRRDEKGGVAIIFGLGAMAITMFAGIALDYTRVMHERIRVTSAIDAAALAAGKAMIDGRLTDDDVRAIARSFFDQNLAGGTRMGSLESFDVQLDRSTNGVEIEADVKVDMTLTRVAGYDSVVFPVRASANFQQQDIELSLALDVTGSMAPAGKMDALKRAGKELVRTLLPEEGTPNKVRIALAPYSSGVNAGALAPAVTGKNVSPCTFEREGADPASESAPGTGDYLKTKGSPGIAAAASCPARAVKVLSDDRQALIDEFDFYTPGGSTAGHLGALWAWYMLSPSWNTVLGNDAAPYDDGGKTKKTMVLMTDGLFNTIGGTNFGDSSPTAARSQQIAVAACESMRRQGITIYTVGFKLEDISSKTLRERAENTLKSCSGNDPTRHFDAAREADLIAAFRSIAEQLNNLRLTN